MTLHAKASSAGSTAGRESRADLGALGLLLLAFTSLLAFVLPGSASGATVFERTTLFTFNGSDTSKGAFGAPGAIEIDHATGSVYVIDWGSGVLDKFNLDGEAQNFTATGESSLDLSGAGFFSDVAVDNSATNPGRIYFSHSEAGDSQFGPIKAFSPTGSPLWELPSNQVNAACGVTVDSEGQLLVGRGSLSKDVARFASTGSPPALLGSIPTGANSMPCRLAIDQSGQNLYVAGDAQRLPGVSKFVGGSLDSQLTEAGAWDIALDRSKANGHLFTAHPNWIKEFAADGSELAEYTANNGIAFAMGVAYSPILDRIYISDFGSGHIRVLGPPVPGEVPDVTINPAQSNAVGSVDLSGTINPLDLEHNYYFQYKLGEGIDEKLFNWNNSATTAPQSITPADSSVHPVSESLSNLEAFKTYHVRLVAENTANGFKNYSSAVSFRTGKKATIAIDDPADVSAHTATISGTVNPGDSETKVYVEQSAHPECLNGLGFSGNAQPSFTFAGNDQPSPIEKDLTGLQPSHSYCVRLAAVNSPGRVESTIKTFTTATVKPSGVVTAFTAPRTDTTARINGRLNPEGEVVTYRFEWSDDDGSTWKVFPIREDTTESYEVLVVSEELTGLNPSTTYSYRFSAENLSGTVQGEVKTFTTRSVAEMSMSGRGMELVNNPDKGNQHVRTLPIGIAENGSFGGALTADGQFAGWTVEGGAPGGSIGSSSPFIATRGPAGWTSESLIPSAGNQFGDGNLEFDLVKASKDLKRAIFVANEGGFSEETDTTVVRSREGAPQEALVTFPRIRANAAPLVDTTSDVAHAVLQSPITGTLSDYGTGTAVAVGLMDDDEPPACGLSFEPVQGQHWIATTDASRVYFRSKGDNCGDPLGLYVRNRDEEATTLLARNAELLRITPDGRTALFVTTQALDDADQNSTRDIYRWEESADLVECQTCSFGEAAVDKARTAADLSRTYFTSPNQLISDEGKKGVENLYVLREDGSLGFVTHSFPRFSALAPEMTRLTPSGHVMIFGKVGSPTTDELKTSCEYASDLFGTCPELYRYDDRDGSIECVTCVPGGVTRLQFEDAGLELSNDGSTFVFSTIETLLPAQDVNKSSDLYEWRNGVVRLITDGETKFVIGVGGDTGRPRPAGIDATGQSVLFTVAADSLTGYEQDGLSNLYVARIGGGFPRPEPQVRCVEDSCQGPLESAPVAASQASAGYRGWGNSTPQKARKQKVRKPRPCTRKRGKAKQRCLKRQRAKANAKAGRGK